MNKYLLFYIFSIFSLCVTAQTKIDSISLWKYKVDYLYKGFDSDSVKARGKITFYRTKGLDDRFSLKHYGKPWKPSIEFSIYEISEIDFVKKESNKVLLISSCMNPEVGGDYFIIGDLILFNRSPCLSCEHNITKVEYCRPIIKFIISKIDTNKVLSVNDLIKQLIIKKSD